MSPQPNAASGADLPNWVTVSQAARHLGVSQKTIRRRIDVGDIRAFQDGGLIRIKRNDLERYIEGRMSR